MEKTHLKISSRKKLKLNKIPLISSTFDNMLTKEKFVEKKKELPVNTVPEKFDMGFKQSSLRHQKQIPKTKLNYNFGIDVHKTHKKYVVDRKKKFQDNWNSVKKSDSSLAK